MLRNTTAHDHGATGGGGFQPAGGPYPFAVGSGIWLGDTTTGAARRIVARGNNAVWWPDSRQLAFLSDRDDNGTIAFTSTATASPMSCTSPTPTAATRDV